MRVVFRISRVHSGDALACSKLLLFSRGVDFVCGDQLCIWHFSSEFNRLHSRLLLRLGEECQQILMSEPLRQVLQIRAKRDWAAKPQRSEEHTSELQSRENLV